MKIGINYMKIICELYVNWYETLLFVYDIQALILYVIISNYTSLFICDTIPCCFILCNNNELFAALCKILCHIYIQHSQIWYN